MREIKFRAWDGEKWLYGDLLRDKPDDPIYYIRFTDEEGDTVARGVDAGTTGQFTGLKDKNGKEIYEGDIVSDIDGCWEVAFNRGCFRFGHGLGGLSGEINIMQRGDDLEVIGNIYENPELLTNKPQ